jgi:FHA domain-containing protein
LKADVTMIASRDNNPLKFAPDGASALAQLLAEQPLRGFMPGPTALRDAFDDLRAHQLAMVTGMRAAMQGLSARFDPTKFEERLSKQNLLHSMVPMARRARLWELFVECYGQLAAEAEDDFDALFGQAFVKAYQEQIDKLEQTPAER